MNTSLHHDRPDPDHFGSFFFLFFWIFLCSLAGLGIGVGIDFVSPATPLPWLKTTLGIATEAFFEYSGLSFFLNLLPRFDFSNAFFGVKPWEDLPGLEGLIPYVSTGAIAGAAVGGKIAWKHHQNVTNPLRHLAGPRILTGPSGAKALQNQISEKFNLDGIKIHPAVQISLRLEIQHMLLIGSTGAGKTTTLWQILEQILSRGDKVLSYDVKSDFTQKLKKRLILGPWDRRSLRWLIGRDITTEALAQAFAECFIIPNPKASDPVWDNAARALLRCEIHKLMAHRGTNWTFRDLGKGLLEDLLVGVDDTVENMQNLQKFVRTYYPEAWQIVRDATSKATASVLFTQGGQLSPLIDICRLDSELALSGAKGFWLDQDSKGFLSDDVKQADPVVLKKSGDAETWSRTFISAFVNVAALKINGLGDSDPDKRRLWFILDEVPQLGKIPQITTFLETSRSKGVRVVLGLQNPEQIDKVYGKEDRATWENNTLTKIWFQDIGKDAKKWASESVGTHTVQIYSRTQTRGHLPPSSGDSNTWSEPKEKKLLEEHDFEMIMRPKPKLKVVTALLQIAGFDRVVLDWPMLPRPIFDPLEKDPVALPPRVLIDECGKVISSNLSFVEDSFGSSGGGTGRAKEESEEKNEKEPVSQAHKTEHVEIPVEEKPVIHEKEYKEEEEVEKEVGEKMITASLSGSGEDFTGDVATDSLKLLAAMLDSSGSSGTVGKVHIAKSTATSEQEEDREDR